MEPKTVFHLPQLHASANPLAAREEPRRVSNPLLGNPPALSESPSHDFAGKRVSPFSQPSYDRTPSTNLTDPLLLGDGTTRRRPRRTLRDYRRGLTNAARLCVYYGMQYIVVMGLTILLTLVLLGIEVGIYIDKRNLKNHQLLITALTTSNFQLSELCVNRIVSGGSGPIAAPPSLSEVTRLIHKLPSKEWGEYMRFVQLTLTSLASADCATAFQSLGELLALLTERLDKRDVAQVNAHMRYFLYFAITISELSVEGPLNFLISQPVSSERALRAFSGNLFCAPQLRALMSVFDASVEDKLVCVESGELLPLLEATPINIPLHSSVFISTIFKFIQEIWHQVNTKPDTYSRVSQHVVVIILLLVTATLNVLLLFRLSVRQRTAHRKHDLVQEDFEVHDNRVGIRHQTLRALDYYCWKAGSLEAVDVNEIVRLGADGEELTRYVDAPAEDRLEPSHDTPSPHRTSSPQKPSHRRSHSAEHSDEPPASVVQVAQSLAADAKTRRRRLRGFVHEARQLRGMTQIELYMHRIVHPLLLLRPFVPDAMLQQFYYNEHTDAGLGPSLPELTTCAVLQDGIELDHAVYVFVSFRKYNTNESLMLATKHFVQLDAERQTREDAVAAAQEKRSFWSCGRRHARRGRRRHRYARLTDDTAEGEATDTIAPPRPLAARLLGDDGFDFAAAAADATANPLHRDSDAVDNDDDTGDVVAVVTHDNHLTRDSLTHPDAHPLSPLAVGLSYVLTYTRLAARRYRGEVVQVSSDGILVQFRTGPPRRERDHYCPTVRTTMEELGLTSTEDDDAFNLCGAEGQGGAGLDSNSELGITSGNIEVGGKRRYMSAEERAVRTAYSVQRSLDHCLDFEDNRYIPLDLLQCPIVVLSDKMSLRGRVGFHVSRHYTVLSQCIPLLFPLEQLCLEYGTGLIMTEDVYECVEGCAVARPFHFFTIADLNCYRFDMRQNESFESKWRTAEHRGRHGSGGATPREVVGGMSADTPTTTSSAGAGRKQDESNVGVEGGTTLRDVVNAGRGDPSTVPPFPTAGSVYEVFSVRNVHDGVESDEMSGENRRRNQVRHTHWKLIWDKYVQMLSYRGSMRLLSSYARVYHHGRAQQGASQTGQPSARDEDNPENEVEVQLSSLAGTEEQSLSSLFSASASQSETLHIKELHRMLCDELHDCHNELTEYKRVYGVRKHEEYSFNKVEQEVLAMLKALGECTNDDDDDDTDSN